MKGGARDTGGMGARAATGVSGRGGWEAGGAADRRRSATAAEARGTPNRPSGRRGSRTEAGAPRRSERLGASFGGGGFGVRVGNGEGGSVEGGGGGGGGGEGRRSRSEGGGQGA